jgi:hypothetical protein
MSLRSFSKYLPHFAFAVGLLSAPAQATVITFEDSGNDAFLSQGYQGFAWLGGAGPSSWVNATPSNGLDFFSAHSGTHYIWSNGGTSLTMSDGLFDFDGMWARTSGASGQVTAHGFLSGLELYTTTFTIGGSYSNVVLNFDGINSITFDETPQFNVIIDDITVNGSVPDGGSTLCLLGLALGAFGWMRRKLGSA